jgi:2'-5' RNA ligase
VAVAVDLIFSDLDEDLIRDWWSLCDAAGVASIGADSAQPPHVTLSVLDCDDTDLLLATLGARLDDQHAPTLMLTHIGLFVRPGTVLYLGVSITDELFQLHERITEIGIELGIHIWEHYRPGIWTPHTTLARGFEFEALHDLLPSSVDDLPDLPVKIRAEAVSVATIPDGTELGRLHLS